MVVSESTDSSFWHKYIIGADRGGGVFDMLPLRGVGLVVPVPESAVGQFSGLSCARPQPGFAGKASVLRMPLASCPGLWPPSAVSSGLMYSHQHMLLGGVLEGGRRPGILEDLGSTRAACRAGLVLLPGHTKKHHPPKPHTHMGMLGPVPVGVDRSRSLGPRKGGSNIGKREGGGHGFQKMAIVMSRTSD